MTKRTVEEQAFLSILRTADSLVRGLDALLKPHGLTTTQYNVLRILRGAGEDGATCTAIASRMITADPDVTRLLDRMEKRGLLVRRRDDRDRRVVLTSITDAGRAMLEELDDALIELHRNQLRGVPKTRLRELIADLDKIRGVES
ncbi:MAG: MarR family transcriptional regulator [Acidobacteria bacterium]|nr:MarR family transcriptional regulator [Acidobacteriota bacterium]MBV9478098.1 MarR family transcriptional regulator [Acidobacteriota bacterium]